MARPGSACRLTTFFGCIPLERGVLIIGISSMFMALMKLFKITIHLVDFQLSFRQCQRLTKIMQKSSGMDDEEMEERFGNMTENKCPRQIMHMLYFALGLRGILWIIYFVVSGLLVYGVKLSKTKLMLPWMMWQAAPIFYAVFSIFSLGFPELQLNLVYLVITTYFLLIVNSYYLEVQARTDRTLPVTIVAVTQTPSGMAVNIPSPGKDLPPPYPGYISESNLVYSSVDETPCPPYGSLYPRRSVSPPPYSEAPAPATNSQRTTTEESAQTSSQTSPTESPGAACREATPLVNKPAQSDE